MVCRRASKACREIFKPRKMCRGRKKGWTTLVKERHTFFCKLQKREWLLELIFCHIIFLCKIVSLNFILFLKRFEIYLFFKAHVNVKYLWWENFVPKWRFSKITFNTNGSVSFRLDLWKWENSWFNGSRSQSP